MPTPGFLTEFPPVETGDWESEIRAAVTGQEYPAKLVWHPEEGLAVKPYYRAEDSRDLSFLSAAPGKFPYVRGARPTAEWRIREDVDASDPEQANSLAREAIAAGADEISFSAVQISVPADLARLLANLENIPLRFQGLAQRSAAMAADWVEGFPAGEQVSADIDPLANLELAAELCCNFPN